MGSKYYIQTPQNYKRTKHSSGQISNISHKTDISWAAAMMGPWRFIKTCVFYGNAKNSYSGDVRTRNTPSKFMLYQITLQEEFYAKVLT